MSTVTTLTPASIALFQNSLSERGRAENTIKAYGSDLRSLLRWAGVDSVSHPSLQSLTAKWLNETRIEAAAKTTERRLISTRAYAKWAGMENFLSDYITPTPARSIPHPLPEGISGVERMMSAATSASHTALFAMQGLLGMRVSEARSIMPRNIDLDERTITIRGKGDKTRVVPLTPKAWEQIKDAYERACRDGGPIVALSDRGARYAVTRTGARVDLRRSISSHDLRATTATAVFDKTKDIRLVQEMLGHASSKTTELYTHVGIDKMREGMEL